MQKSIFYADEYTPNVRRYTFSILSNSTFQMFLFEYPIQNAPKYLEWIAQPFKIIIYK